MSLPSRNGQHRVDSPFVLTTTAAVAGVTPVASPSPIEADVPVGSVRAASGQTSRFHVVCFSPQDWDTPLRTNRQRIMIEAAARGHEVVYVETGDWLPGAFLAHRRGMTWRAREVQPGLRVRRSPSVTPYSWRFAGSLAVNVALERGVLRAERPGRRPRVAWLYDPRYIDAAFSGHFDLIVYDCVDDYAQQVRPSARSLMTRMDARATRLADVVYVTSPGLLDGHIRNNARTRLVPNVADYDHFAAGRFLPMPKSLQGLPRPIIGFAGSIVANKVDLAGLARLIESRPEWSWVLIGPVERRLRADLAALARNPQVHYLGLVDYESLPAYVARFDVGLIPYSANPYTASVWPLKYYEYLAAGIPVVASGLSGLPDSRRDIQTLVHLGPDSAAAILQALGASSPDDVARRQSLASTHTWAHRADVVLAGAEDALAARRRHGYAGSVRPRWQIRESAVHPDASGSLGRAGRVPSLRTSYGQSRPAGTLQRLEPPVRASGRESYRLGVSLWWSGVVRRACPRFPRPGAPVSNCWTPSRRRGAAIGWKAFVLGVSRGRAAVLST